jgi:hypothetical protein
MVPAFSFSQGNMNYQLIPFPLNFYRVRYSSQVTVNMARPTFKGYMDNIQIKTGKTLDDFWKLANEKGLVERGKVVAKHSEMLVWLKSKEIGLGHVHANFIILYLRLRTNDPKLSAQSKKWAYSTGYKERAIASKKNF